MSKIASIAFKAGLINNPSIGTLNQIVPQALIRILHGLRTGGHRDINLDKVKETIGAVEDIITNNDDIDALVKIDLIIVLDNVLLEYFALISPENLLSVVERASKRGELIQKITEQFPVNSINTKQALSRLLFSNDPNLVSKNFLYSTRLNSRPELSRLFAIEKSILDLTTTKFKTITGSPGIHAAQLRDIQMEVSSIIKEFILSNPYNSPYVKKGISERRITPNYEIIRGVWFSFADYLGTNKIVFSEISSLCGGKTSLTLFLIRGMKFEDHQLKRIAAVLTEYNLNYKNGKKIGGNIEFTEDALFDIDHYKSDLPSRFQLFGTDYHLDFSEIWMDRFILFSALPAYVGFDPLFFNMLEEELFDEGSFEDADEKNRNTAEHHWKLGLLPKVRKLSASPLDLVITSNKYHGQYDSNKFKTTINIDGVTIYTGQLKMQSILNGFLELVAKKEDISIADIKNIFNIDHLTEYLLAFFETQEQFMSLSQGKREQIASIVVKDILSGDVKILDNYWKIEEPTFTSRLAQFNERKSHLRVMGAESFLKRYIRPCYDRYNGDLYQDWLRNLDPFDISINDFSSYLREAQAFREYMKFLGPVVEAGRW
jgi:hypothetical protein